MMVICIVLLQVLLQAVSVAVTYMYFTNEMKQLQDNYSKIGLACFSKTDEDFWDSTDGEILNRPCLQVKRQLYYIYSQTYFRFQEAEDASKMVSKDKVRTKQLVQYIYKYTSYPDPIVLMKSARNSCWSRDAEYGLYSIYQGGLFELKKNDRIFVSVTNEHLMDLDQEASFFGAFLIN